MLVHPDGKVIIRYTGGDRGVCQDKEMSSATEIIFECDSSVVGTPKFKEYVLYIK